MKDERILQLREELDQLRKERDQLKAARENLVSGRTCLQERKDGKLVDISKIEAEKLRLRIESFDDILAKLGSRISED